MTRKRNEGKNLDIVSPIRTVLVDPDVAESRRALDLLEKIKGDQLRTDSEKERSLSRSRRLKDSSGHGKRTLSLSHHKGEFLKKCPGSPGQVCCGYRVLNIINNCPFDCAYCILQSYLDSRDITVYVNIEDAAGELRKKASERPGTIFRVGTGELADSLAIEPLMPLSRDLIHSLVGIDNVYLELKTKSVNVSGLIGLDHGGRVIVSWSLGPDPVVREYEPGTMPVARRLEAARRVQADGYLLGFHFDPIIRYDGWEDDYRRLVDTTFDAIDPERVVWISLGCLRYPPALKEAALDRPDRSRIFLDEFVPCPDGKMRYIRPVREEIYRKMRGWLQERAPSAELYLCMESTLMWKNVFDLTPDGENWLSDRLDRAVSRFDKRSSICQGEHEVRPCSSVY